MRTMPAVVALALALTVAAAAAVTTAAAHGADGHAAAAAAALRVTAANASVISGAYRLDSVFEPKLGVSESEPCHNTTSLIASPSAAGDILTVPYDMLSEDGLRCSGEGRIVLLGAGALNGTANGTAAGLTSAEVDALEQLEGNPLALAVVDNVPDDAVRVGLYTADRRVCRRGGTSRQVSAVTLVVAVTGVEARRVGVDGRTANLPSGTVWVTFTPGGDAGLLTQPVCIFQRQGAPSLPSPSTGGDDGVCFPADATVQRRDGAVLPLSAVSVGDELRVAAGSGAAAWSRVYMFSHRLLRGTRPFVELTTASGAALTATASHLVYASGALVPAGDVAVGDALEVVDARTGEAVSSPVVASRVVGRAGLVNPHTLHGDLVVNGVRASTWTTAVEPAVASALLAPARLAWRLGGVDASAGVLEGGARGIRRLARLLPRWTTA